MADNVIQIIMRSVNEMSVDLAKVNADLAKLQGTTQATSGTFEKASQSSRRLQSALAPAHRAVSQVFSAMAALNPESRILVGNLDNLVFGAMLAAQRTGSLAAAFNPLTIAIALVAAAVGVLIFKYQEAKKATEEFNKAQDESILRLTSLRAKTAAAFSGPAQLQSTITDIMVEFAAKTKAAREKVDELRGAMGTYAKEAEAANELWARLFDIPQGELKLPQGSTSAQQKELQQNLNTIREAQVEANRKIQDATKVFNEQARKRAVDLKNQLLQAEAEVLESGERITEAYDKRTEALQRAYTESMRMAENETVRNELTRKFVFDQIQLLEKQRIAIDKIIEKQFVLQQQQKLAGTFFGATDEAAAEAFAKQKEIVDRRIKGLQTQGQITNVIDEERQAHLQTELRTMEAFERPYSEILRIINEMDKLEKERLETQIKQTQEIVKQLELGGQEKEAERLIAEARLKALESRKEKGDVGLGVIFKKEEIHKQAEDMADTLAGDFVDRFMDFLDGKKMDLSTFLRDLGKTIVSQFLQGMLAQNLVGPLQEMLTGQTGAQRRQTMRGGTAGVLLGKTMDLFGLGRKEDTRSLEEIAKADLAKLTEKIGSAAVRALDTVGMVTQDMEQGIQLLAATGLDAAALNLTGASASLQGAATALVNAASALSIAAGGSGGGGGKLPFIGNVSNLFGGGLDLGPFERTGGEFDFNWLFSGKGGYLGGNFVPVAALRKFQKGGVANRPTIGVIGEEGDEIVARMKPARPQDSETRGVSVIIQGDIVPRERNMRREDVIMIVADDMERGGKTATAGIKLGNRR